MPALTKRGTFPNGLFKVVIVTVVSQWQKIAANIATVHAEPKSLNVFNKSMLAMERVVQNNEMGPLKLLAEAAVECEPALQPNP